MNSGKIIILAFPDTYVKMCDDFLCKLLPLVGLGTKEYIKAGHAALLLVNTETGNLRYFDFGRYVTPKGFGRVRSAITDFELKLPFQAKINSENEVTNLEEILIWLEANPKKTHGDGRLVASVCEDISFEKAEKYILNLQNRGSLPYSAFNKLGSNCSRFVTETILASTEKMKIIKALHFNKKFTPSCIGNVEKASSNGMVYEVIACEVTEFTGSAFKENLSNYFHRKKKESPINNSDISTEKKLKVPENAHYLDGIGSGAWFRLKSTDLPNNPYRITRYNSLGEQDFDGLYITSDDFDPSKDFEFTYDSHCEYCHIIQNGKKIKFNNVGEYLEINSYRMAHSV